MVPTPYGERFLIRTQHLAHAAGEPPEKADPILLHEALCRSVVAGGLAHERREIVPAPPPPVA